VNVGGQPSGRVTERIERQQQAVTQTSSVGTQCELNITMAGVEPQNIEATVTSPSGTTQRCDLIDLGANRYTVKFVPREMGVHTVSLKHKGLHIPGQLHCYLLHVLTHPVLMFPCAPLVTRSQIPIYLQRVIML